MLANNKKQNNAKYKSYARWSKILYPLMKWTLILSAIYLFCRMFISPIISKLIHASFDHDKLRHGYADFAKKAEEYFDIGSAIPPSSMPHTATWGQSYDKWFMMDINKFILLAGTVFFSLLALYFLTMLMRKRSGEYAPYQSDKESRVLKKRIIQSIGAKRRILTDEPGKSVKTDEATARFRLRHMKVSIHVVAKRNVPEPTKMVEVLIKRLQQNDAINTKMVKKLDNMPDILSSQTGISFGNMETIEDGRIYRFMASKMLSSVPESWFVRRRRKKADENGENLAGMEYAFPLDLFTDNSAKIEEKTEMAQNYSDEVEKAVRNYLASQKVQVDTGKIFTGNTSVQIEYKLPPYISSLPQTDQIESGLDTTLNVTGISAQLKGSGILITVPLPNDYNIPIDVSTMIKQEFTKKSADPTRSIMGIQPDSTNVMNPISKAPHFLVAGTTGSGKSVFINSLLITMMSQATPDELKLAIIDPKTVEFTAYKDLPYMLVNPVTDMSKANNLVIYLTNVMDKRYRDLADKGVKNLEEYNEKAEKEGFPKLPFIVLVIDEFADLISQFKEVDKPVARIGQKARAAGIHMIIATQSPRREVITGLIKANVPSRVSLMVANSTESQIVLDETGGEKLKPRGDFWLKMNGGNKVRGQAPYVSNDEIDDIFKYIRENYDKPELVDFEAELEKDKDNDDTASQSARGFHGTDRTRSRLGGMNRDRMKSKADRERDNKIYDNALDDDKEKKKPKTHTFSGADIQKLRDKRKQREDKRESEGREKPNSTGKVGMVNSSQPNSKKETKTLDKSDAVTSKDERKLGQNKQAVEKDNNDKHVKENKELKQQNSQDTVKKRDELVSEHQQHGSSTVARKRKEAQQKAEMRRKQARKRGQTRATRPNTRASRR